MRRRWIGALAAAFVAVVALTLAARAGSVVHGSGGPSGEWIWLPHDRRQAQPLAFYLARDFDLAAPPSRARLLALGDPEYVLYLNGKRVGAGGWRPGARLDQYEVAPLLRPGGNRLLAELRSPDGAGGLLAGLVDTASGRTLVSTDGAWRAFRRHRLGLPRGWLPVDAWTAPAAVAGPAAAVPGEAAFSWGRPPTGRWGRVAPGWPRPLFSELTAGRRPLPAVSAAPYVPPPETGLAADSSMVLFDWGREVAGYLALEPGYDPEMDPDLAQPPPDRQRTALLWTGDAPPRLAGAGAEPSGAVVLLAGARQWLDVRLRRFRYALVIGLERPLAARVYEVDSGVAARFGMEIAGGSSAAAATEGAAAGAGPGSRGVFGLAAPPRLRSPVEDEIRRKLERFQGVAGRKGL
jgi:hypothetical protein